MFLKQLCVFIENRTGRLNQLTKTLMENKINIICISVADTIDYGMLRMIVSDPEKTQKVLIDNGYASVVNEVLGIKFDNNPGSLNKLANLLADNNINIDYMYAFTSGSINASVILKTSDIKRTYEIIKNDFEILTTEEVYSL